MKYKKISHELLADFYTPVSLFLRLRQKYIQALLLESSDYSSKEDSHSFICFDVLESFVLQHSPEHNLKINGELKPIKQTDKLLGYLKTFLDEIDIDTQDSEDAVFGFSCYDSVQYFENLKFSEKETRDNIPLMRYDFYRFVLRFDHFHEKIELVEYIPEGESSRIADVLRIIRYQHTPEFVFSLNGGETSNIDDDTFRENVRKAREHLKRGDIFQIVLSRSFSSGYKGDVFNVYRRLRSINPSPYLYFFDYGAYKIFGSSPEAQIVVKEGMAEIHPIAGTLKRSGSAEDDRIKAELLRKDPKENAEHVMLVDLARNDLGKHGTEVSVKKYKEIQYFSHVVHLTSVVEAKLKNREDSIHVFADTFPAGTLSGAPKYRAMQLIDGFETSSRGFYGGAIGILGLNGNINHAILIRSFLARDNVLRYQAGAGIVIDSDENRELQEVNNKLAALKKAIKLASNI